MTMTHQHTTIQLAKHSLFFLPKSSSCFTFFISEFFFTLSMKKTTQQQFFLACMTGPTYTALRHASLACLVSLHFSVHYFAGETHLARGKDRGITRQTSC
jgi:hypothetical protein